MAAVPRGRGPGAPIAEALAAFEEDLRAAQESLERWPSGDAGEVRRACLDAIAESLRRAESLRLEATPEGYEELYVLLGEVLDPLEAFDQLPSEPGD